VIKCSNVDYESFTREKFNCLQLNVKDATSIEESIRKYVAWRS